MCKRIDSRHRTESREESGWQSSESDLMRLRKQLITDLLEQENLALTDERLLSEYHLNVKSGRYQTFCIKMDYDQAEVNASTLEIVEEKINDILEVNLKPLCQEIVWSMREMMEWEWMRRL